jgi:hypothetical protein
MTGKPITMRRIRRMRAEPRIVSLAGLRDTDGGGKEIDIIDDDSTDETVFEQPKVLRSVLMRAEAESEQTNLGHTSVKTIKAAEEALRIVPPSIARGDPTSTLKGGVRGQIKRRHSTVNNPPSAVTEAAALKQMSSQLLGEGLVLESGRSTVVKLHQHDMRTFTLHHRGTQGMRVAAYNDAGQPLLDVDLLATEEQQSIVLPLKSDYLVVTGYGGDEALYEIDSPDAGAISLHHSTDDTAGAGFHPRTRLVSTPVGYVCRGGMVSLSSTGLEDRPWVAAVDALRTTKEAVFHTSSNISTFAIVHAHDDPPSVESNGVEFISDASVIQGTSLSISIWAVKRSTDSSLCTISTSFVESGSLHSMVALAGHHQEWVEFFKSRDWTTIIEEGAICGHGESILHLSAGDEQPQLKRVEDVAPSLKKDRNRPSQGPRFNLGALAVGEVLKKDLSKHAADKEQDAMVFSMLSGPKNASVSKDGVLNFTPQKEDVGLFEIVVQVSDSGGTGGTATFHGTVVDENTRPYWVGGE